MRRFLDNITFLNSIDSFSNGDGARGAYLMFDAINRSPCLGLTHQGRDKMTVISQRTFQISIFVLFYFDWNFSEICSESPNKLTTAQIIMWYRTGDMPLCNESLLACFTDAYMHHSAPLRINHRFRQWHPLLSLTRIFWFRWYCSLYWLSWSAIIEYLIWKREIIHIYFNMQIV